jgi:hypothetical protein
MNIDKTHASPNRSARTTPVAGVLMHATGGTNSLSHLCNPAPIDTRKTVGGNPNPMYRKPNPALAVSIHYLIDKWGTVYQLVDEDDVAWHAGEGDVPGYPGRNEGNGILIGIELENLNNGKDDYPEAQFTAAVELVQDIVQRHTIARNFVIRHLDYAPKRKVDPKGFDWERFVQNVFEPTAAPRGNVTPPKKYWCLVRKLWIRTDRTTKANNPFFLTYGQELLIDDVSPGELVIDTNQWAHLADGRGFVSLRYLSPTPLR